jgi:hypothetical protein
MAIHYDAKLKRFRDGSGKLVSKAKAMRSSIARREYEQAVQKAAAVRKPTAVAKRVLSDVPPRAQKPAVLPRKKPRAPAKAVVLAPAAKPIPPKKKTKPKKPGKVKPFRAFEEEDLPPWMREGVVREYPRSWEWFRDDEYYSYDELIEDWGEYDDDETTSGGERDEA